MPALASDVYRACFALSERGLHEGRSRREPVQVCWNFSTHAVITNQSGLAMQRHEVDDLLRTDPMDVSVPPGLCSYEEITAEVGLDEPCFLNASAWQADVISRVDRVAANLSTPAQSSGPRFRRPARVRVSQMTLASSLASMEDKDPECIIYVRQIQKLGLDSSEILRKHYEQYGEVDDILLSNAHEKLGRTPFRVRLRPSGIGMVLMKRREDAQAAVAAGELQTVNNVTIRVRRFEARGERQTSCSAVLLAKEHNLRDSESDAETSCPLTSATSFTSLDEDLERVSMSSSE